VVLGVRDLNSLELMVNAQTARTGALLHIYVVINGLKAGHFRRSSIQSGWGWKYQYNCLNM